MNHCTPFGVREASLGAGSPGAATRYVVSWGLHAGACLGVLVGVFLEGRPALSRSPRP